MISSKVNAVENKQSAAFFYLVNNPTKFSLFLLKKLPAAFFSGLKIKEAEESRCVVTVPYKWFTQNPFRSTYFACLSMAAEMATGLLAMAHIFQQKPAVSMLIIEMNSRFHKKASGTTFFMCNDGLMIKDAVQKAMDTGEAQIIKAYSSGKNEAGEMVAEFWFTWSFKAKGSKKPR